MLSFREHFYFILHFSFFFSGEYPSMPKNSRINWQSLQTNTESENFEIFKYFDKGISKYFHYSARLDFYSFSEIFATFAHTFGVFKLFLKRERTHERQSTECQRFETRSGLNRGQCPRQLALRNIRHVYQFSSTERLELHTWFNWRLYKRFHCQANGALRRAVLRQHLSENVGGHSPDDAGLPGTHGQATV